MNVLTLKIPDDLAAAMQASSHQRGLSKSAVVREALEASLMRHAHGLAAAERWLTQWRGQLAKPPRTSAGATTARPAKPGKAAVDPRLAHLMSKHAR